jgi:iron complex transport system substrate-binding protein
MIHSIIKSLYCQKPLCLLIFALLLFSCQKNESQEIKRVAKDQLKYAKGFTIEEGDDFYILKVKNAYPGAKEVFQYLVLKDKNSKKPDGSFDATINLPIQKLVVTSTTHIPHLDLLNVSDKLIGFPNLNLISSEKVTALIAQNKIVDLGKGASSNIEKLIALNPDWVMISTLGEEMSQINFLNKAGIPAIINGEYTEQHPLGRAEWIKFTGVLLGKTKEAGEVFDEIEKEYLAALNLAKAIEEDNKPRVLSGVMYKDTWFAPAGNSWGALLIEAAGGKYIFEDEKGMGSLQLNYEYVLDKAMDVDLWIGAADYSTLQSLKSSDPRYSKFKAFKNAQIYSYTLKKGTNGGFEYFELGYMRPDLILKDLIKIMHPQLLPDYSPYFYEKLKNE